MKNNLLNPFVPCSATIFLDEKGMTSTYCMREKGHSGEHGVEREVALDEEKKLSHSI